MRYSGSVTPLAVSRVRGGPTELVHPLEPRAACGTPPPRGGNGRVVSGSVVYSPHPLQPARADAGSARDGVLRLLSVDGSTALPE